MDRIAPRQGSHSSSRAQHRPVYHGRQAQPHAAAKPARKPRHSGEMYWLVRSIGKTAAVRKNSLLQKFRASSFVQWHTKSKWRRIYVVFTLVLFIVSTVVGIVQPLLGDNPYRLPVATRAVIPEPNSRLGERLNLNVKEAKYLYNDGYVPTGDRDGTGDPRFTAAFPTDPKKGVTVSDPVNQVDFTMKPKFRLGVGKKDNNQMIYPLGGWKDGWLVYTAQIASVKEDIVLQSFSKDKLTFEYQLVLTEGLTAKLEKDGSVGVYGPDLPLYGSVATGTEKDAELLQKARQNAPKTKFLFGIPAPYVKETGKKESSVSTKFELEGDTLRVVTEGLKKASYPLTIDPSIFIQTAAQLMKGNNESNVEFDVATEQFKKGTTTGARIDEWTQTGAMNDATYDQAVAAAGGYVYRAGGRSGQIIPYVADYVTAQTGTASTTTTLNMPSYRPAGFLYIAIIGFDGDVSITNTPSGWSNLVSNVNGTRAFYHVGGANEPATYTWNTSANQQSAAIIMRIANADTSVNPIGTSRFGSSGQVPTYNGITPTQNGSLIIGAASLQQAVPQSTGYAPVNNTEITSLHSTGVPGTGTAGLVASSLDAPPLSGVSPGAQATRLPSASNAWGSVTIAIYGSTATPSYQNSVQWAHFNGTTGSIESPAPGSNGTACTNWCTDNGYNLPTGSGASDGAGTIGGSMVAYNGYLYYTGGSDGTTVKNTVYIAKLGAKGEPSLWHPTDPDQPDWVYWYKHTALSSARAYHSMYAYNGKMYILGGDTDLGSYNTGALDTVQVADILPNGTLGTWSSGTTMPYTGYGISVQGYNGYLYLMGGNNNGAMVTDVTDNTKARVYYTKLNSDGSMNSWQPANVTTNTPAGFSTGRSSMGGVMSGIWGGYIYVAGGCSAVNTTGNGYCNSIASDMQLASINADGTLDAWNTMANVTHQRFGSSFIAWQDSLYRFGGCSSQATGSDTCYATHIDNQYGEINQDGDASTVSKTSASGTAPCSGSDPYDCNLPPVGDGAGQGGQMLSGTAILNGYLYVIGGCGDLDCSGGTQVSGNVSYVAISSDGKLKRPPSCQYTTYGSWCVDDVNNVNGDTGIAAPGVTVFGNHIYVVGGLSGSGNVTNIYRNSVNSDGSLAGTWASQAQTFANLGITQSVAYTFAYTRANPASSTHPGNLYLFGGCGATSGAGCTGNDYRTEVWKCKIEPGGNIDEDTADECTTSGQLQIDSDPGTGGNQGLGIHAGTVYANYIYLMGGLNGGADLNEVRYAKFDNNNNVVAVSGGSWVESSIAMNVGRRRGTAFGYNGYLYAVGGYEGTGADVLDTIEFVKVNVSDGSLISTNTVNPTKFKQSAVTITQRWGLGLAVSNSYAYVIGGCATGQSPDGCTAFDATVQTFQVYNNDSGAPAGYKIPSAGTSKYTTDRIGAGVAIYNGYIYVAGGCVGVTDCNDATDNVQFAPIDAYGEVGTWANTNDATLPGQRAFGQMEVAGGTLYFIGGQDDAGDEKPDVYYGTPSGAGDVTTWNTATNGLPASGNAGDRTQFSSVVWNNRIYVTGGVNDSAAVTNTIYTSPQLNSGGDITSAWTTTGMTAFSVARSGHTAIAYANNLYILGGYDGTNYLSDVQFTQINSDGTLDSWTYTTSLPTRIRQADGFGSNGYLYLFGGRSSANDCNARTLIAPVSANTTIATGNNPTGIGEWYQTNRNFDGGRYGVGAAYYAGKAYVLGGGCQGVVMADDFDSTIDSGQWTYTTGMTAGTACQSTSTTNTLYTNTGGTGNYAATKDVDVLSGGTIYFKFYIPGADTGSCYAGEANLIGGSPDNVTLEYDTNDNWGSIEGTIATYNYNGNYDPMVRVAAAIPAGAQTASTRFRWVMSQGEATDSFSIEDVSIVATGSTAIFYQTNSRVTWTGLLSQPQVANYSRLVDAGKDVFPKTFLMGGTDNSIGARWQLNYKSMNNPAVPTGPSACGGTSMTAYGASTNFGNVTLDRPGAYTVKDGSGANIGCGRYFFLNVSIDASQTYGYPDDIARGPTLDNLMLFFESNPGQRLLHGKTFLEGTQQPLDTPCRQSNPADVNAACPYP